MQFYLDSESHHTQSFFHFQSTPLRSVSAPSPGTCGANTCDAPLTALALADHAQLHLLLAGAHVELALAGVGGAVAAAHGLAGLHALGRTHAAAALGVADRPKRAVGAGLIWMEIREGEGEGELGGAHSVYVRVCVPVLTI